MKKVISCVLLVILLAFIFITGDNTVKAKAEVSFGSDVYFTRVGQAIKVKMNGAVQKQIKWTSRDPKIAKITKKGKIKGVKVGETTIAAEYKGTRLTFKMVVVPKKMPKVKVLYTKLREFVKENRTNPDEARDFLDCPEYEYENTIISNQVGVIILFNDSLQVDYVYDAAEVPSLIMFVNKDEFRINDMSTITKKTKLDISTNADTNKKANKLFHEMLANLDDFLFEKMPEYTLADLGFINY